MSLKQNLSKVSLGEWTALIGILLSTTGQFLKSYGFLNNYLLQVIGLAIFLGGVIHTLREILNKILELKSDNAVLRTIREFSEAGISTRNQNSVYIRATSEFLDEMIKSYVPNISHNLQGLAKNDSLELEIQDHSPIFELMYKMGRYLPKKGAWMGITRLQSSEAWTNPYDKQFIHFRDLMRESAKKGEMSVLRLYFFETKEAYKNLKSVLEDEVENNIVTRYLIGGKPPPDISILWIPPKNLNIDEDSMNDHHDDPISRAFSLGYEPICLLDYDTYSGSLLTKMTICRPASKLFKGRVIDFRESWKSGKPFLNVS